MESMTNAPYLLPQARAGYRMGNGALVDSMINDGLWEAYKGFHMGVGAEMIAAKYGIGRDEHPARQKGQGPFERAHMPVGEENGDAGVREDGFNLRNQHEVVGAKKFDQFCSLRSSRTCHICPYKVT